MEGVAIGAREANPHTCDVAFSFGLIAHSPIRDQDIRETGPSSQTESHRDPAHFLAEKTFGEIGVTTFDTPFL